MQRLKFIRTAAEKNLLFSFICISSGIHNYIRHDTTNRDTIKQYEDYVRTERDYLELDEVEQFNVKMLADVIESIIGAILLDSYNIETTEKAWLELFEPFLKRYADNPRSPPKRKFTKFCEERSYLKPFSKNEFESATLSKEQLKTMYGIDFNNSIMRYDFKYLGTVVFTRYYDNNVKSKEKRWYKELLVALKSHAVPSFIKSVHIISPNDPEYLKKKKEMGEDIEAANSIPNVMYKYSKFYENKQAEHNDINFKKLDKPKTKHKILLDMDKNESDTTDTQEFKTQTTTEESKSVTVDESFAVEETIITTSQKTDSEKLVSQKSIMGMKNAQEQMLYPVSFSDPITDIEMQVFIH